MKTFFLPLMYICISISLNAQSLADPLLIAIEGNNTRLKALRLQAESQKLDNKTNIYLQAPEGEFGYLWGNTADHSNRIDIHISQTFDIPTLSGMKGRLSDRQNNSVDWQYRISRMEILLHAKQIVIELSYLNQRKNEMEVRLLHAQLLAQALTKQFESGYANRLDHNKAYLNLAKVQNELSKILLERQFAQAQLIRLNGGHEIDWHETDYPMQHLPDTPDEWMAENFHKDPRLVYSTQEVEISKENIHLQKANRWPVFSVGYASEKVGAEHFQGAIAGIHIPLWENKNQITKAKTIALAAQANQIDLQQQYQSMMVSLFTKVAGLQSIANSYAEAMKTTYNIELLDKALQAGEISVLTYLTELSAFYELNDLVMEAERDFQLALAELLAVEL
ncbi:MAG: TolC family protein [Bacteroidales bacterium]|jgi:outer membrane protein TolC|nr:TolC family protein [Bacteroidales bacterium]MDD3701883.1 TolC family protein [Bacteroidales bacterium]MDY0369639.1 TolC family protein [Bacteroidales bacterium]